MNYKYYRDLINLSANEVMNMATIFGPRLAGTENEIHPSLLLVFS